jgi:formylglycine-generating enzyme required for sulfatase activity
MANSRDRAWPCGQLQPNDLGLFDMLGNLFEWCQDEYRSYPTGGDEAVSDNMNASSFTKDKDSRLLRGGTFSYLAALVRSAFRIRNAPAIRFILYGFRPARTYP